MISSYFSTQNYVIKLTQNLDRFSGGRSRQVILSNLSLILVPELCSEAIFNNTGRTEYFSKSLEATKAQADREGIVLEYNGLILNDRSQHCTENVHNSCVINAEGDVLPCVFVNPLLPNNRDSSGKEPTTYILKNESYSLEGFSFGNIRHDSFARIWQSSRYAGFRDLFKYGALMESGYFMSDLPDRCMNCYKRLLV